MPRAVRRSERTALWSWNRTPDRSPAARSPQASRAGSSITVRSGTRSPARYSGESTWARVAVSSSRVTSMPCDRWTSTLSDRSSACQSVTATFSSPVRSAPQSMPWRSMVATMASRFSSPIRTRSSISSGQWAIPFSSPWVSEASQNPPLRPEAPIAVSPASRTTIDRPGSVSTAHRAAHNPVKPPPTMTRSAVVGPASGGADPGRPGWSSQRTEGAASASAVSMMASDGLPAKGSVVTVDHRGSLPFQRNTSSIWGQTTKSVVSLVLKRRNQ